MSFMCILIVYVSVFFFLFDQVTINDDADVVTCPSPIPEKIPTRQTGMIIYCLLRNKCVAKTLLICNLVYNPYVTFVSAK